ncbi:MAG: DNA-3-methyladenine glycosylase [bacterium]|nr:DNA-3-methyladenine glycosylase [bacterium]
MHRQRDHLDQAFYERPAADVAKDLIGCVLDRTLDDGTRLAGYISETEAYVGPEDRASHAFGGRRTPRNASMWAPPGTAYVYFTYGMHHCLNVSCLRQDHPAAVLIRAVFPILGLDALRSLRTKRPRKHPLKDRHLCDGPGKLCQAFAIDLSIDGVNLLHSSQIAIRQGVAIDEGDIQCTPRIGIGSAGDWVGKPLRWVTRVDPR